MFSGLFPSALFTSHRGQSGGRGLSPRIWSKVYGQAMSPDGFSNVYFAGDDFLNFGSIAPSAGGTTSGTAHQGYGYYVDTTTAAAAISQLATMVGGGTRFSLPAQDNYDAILTSGGNTGVLGVVSDTAGADKLLAFEARFRLGQVSNNTYNWFVGLSEEGCAATDGVFTDAGAVADKDRLGFWVLEGDGDSLIFGYKKASQTIQSLITFSTALVADTWYKVGFLYDPTAPRSKRISVYLNNEEQSTYVTADLIEAATFPDAEELAFLAGLKNGSAATKTADLDWWHFAQAG